MHRLGTENTPRSRRGADHICLALQTGLHHGLEPEVEDVVEVHIAQQDANGAALWGAFLTADARRLPGRRLSTSDQAEQARVADSVLDEASNQSWFRLPKKFANRLKDPAHLPPR